MRGGNVYLHCTALPTLRGRNFKELVLEDEAIATDRRTGRKAGQPNPRNDPKKCGDWLDELAKEAGTHHVIGDFMKPRKVVWAEHPHYKGSTSLRHWGLDINNLVAGTPVAVPRACTVVEVVKDTSAGGWGGAILFRLDRPFRGARYFILAHLSHHGLPKVGQHFTRGQLLMCTIGSPKENGGWFVHLHIQLMSAEIVEACKGKSVFDCIDGYGPDDEESNPHIFDPTPLVMVRAA